uniref:Uncharacterized protein n=1 Tax=Junco hyemalis TaxID=40217 RepID=A0A8C5NM85_JUNHY
MGLYLLSECVFLAGFGSLMQDVLWCFSQVKGAIDDGVTECKFIFPFVAVTKITCHIHLAHGFPHLP